LSRLSPASLSCPPRTPQPPLFPYTPLFRSPVLLGLRADRHRHAVDGTGGEDAPRLEGGRGRIDPLPQAAEVGAPALVDRVLVLQVTSVQLLDEGRIVAGKGGETELHFTLTPRRTNRPGR